MPVKKPHLPPPEQRPVNLIVWSGRVGELAAALNVSPQRLAALVRRQESTTPGGLPITLHNLGPVYGAVRRALEGAKDAV